jgi:large conductance mechanosensitive channel
MAVGIIIGVAFSGIVSSFVGDLMMPLLGLLVGKVDFKSLSLVLRAASGDTPAVVFAYGKFIQAVVDFLIIAFAVFLFVRGVNSMRRKEEQSQEAPAVTQEYLLSEIRDLLKKNINQ